MIYGHKGLTGLIYGSPTVTRRKRSLKVFFRNHTKLAIWLVGLFIFYMITGFLVIPAILEAKLPSLISEHIGKPVVVKEVDLNPFRLSVNVRGFEIQESDGTPLLGFRDLYINFELSSIYRGAMTFDQIRLVLPYGVIVVRPDGTLNISDLVRASSSPSPVEEEPVSKDSSQANPLPALDIYSLSIERGVFEFHDKSDATPFVADIVPIEISLKNFSTNPNSNNPYSVTAEIPEGGTLNWEGIVSVDPIWSEGTLSVNGLNLRTVWEYLQDVVQFEIITGNLHLGTNYRFEFNNNNNQILLSSAELHLQEFTLSGKGNSESLISIPSLDVEGVTVDVSNKQVEIPSVRSRDARFLGQLNPDGVLNFQELFSPVETQTVEPESASSESISSSPAVTEKSSEAKPWSMTVKELTIDDYALAFEDYTLETPAKLGLESIKLQVHDVSTDVTKPIDFVLSVIVNQTGKADAKGQVQIEPLLADLELALSHIALKPFQPYMDPFVQMDLHNGAISVKGNTQYHGSLSDQPLLSFRGQAAVSNLALANKGQSKAFLTWDSLSFQKVAFQVDPTTVRIGEIALTKSVAKIVRRADGATNVGTAFSPPARSEAEVPEDPEEKKAHADGESTKTVPVKIDAVRITKAGVIFLDRSLKPNARVGIQDFTGIIQGLSSEQLAKADVDLKGRLDQYAPFSIKGKINPLRKNAYTDLTFLVKNWGLTGVSPYSGKYAGYPITQGKLSLQLDYKISEHTLEGDNKLLLDQLTMGKATHSPDAPSLPIPLALALLKDRRGRIDIDMPVRGNLDDPEFSYGGVVFQALVNVITKAAVSPFGALRGLLGEEAESLQYIEFPPGKAKLNDHEREKLIKVAKALTERPGLRLEIAGTADLTSDRTALAQETLKTQLRELKLKELQASEPESRPRLEEMVVAQDEEAQLIKRLYGEKFGYSEKKNLDQPPTSLETMRQKLLETIQVPESVIRHLAQDRAKFIRNQLIEQGRIPTERLFMIKVNLHPERRREGVVRTTLGLVAS